MLLVGLLIYTCHLHWKFLIFVVHFHHIASLHTLITRVTKKKLATSKWREWWRWGGGTKEIEPFEQVECDLWESEDVGCCHQRLLWLHTSPLVNVNRLTTLLLRYLRRNSTSRNGRNTSEFSINAGRWQLWESKSGLKSLSCTQTQISIIHHLYFTTTNFYMQKYKDYSPISSTAITTNRDDGRPSEWLLIEYTLQMCDVVEER